MDKYRIIMKDSIGNLQDTVEGYLEVGWECQGGVAVLERYNSSQYFYQAMVRKGEDEELKAMGKAIERGEVF
jgi:hypothetical protein